MTLADLDAAYVRLRLGSCACSLYVSGYNDEGDEGIFLRCEYCSMEWEVSRELVDYVWFGQQRDTTKGTRRGYNVASAWLWVKLHDNNIAQERR